jgi:hypothetical protein
MAMGGNLAKTVFTHTLPIHWTKNSFSRQFHRLLKLMVNDPKTEQLLP